MVMTDLDREFYYKDNVASLEDIKDYYSKMEKELESIFEEVIPTRLVEHNLYVFLIPFRADTCGLIINHKDEISFVSEEAKILFGKKLYDAENREIDIIEPCKEDYLEKYAEYGNRLPRFPYIQRHGTIPDYLHTDEIYEFLSIRELLNAVAEQ